MMRFLLFLTLWTLVVSEDSSSSSSSLMSYGTCFRRKINNDNDDDGNSYFYNGAYRAQYDRYAVFQMCESSSCGLYVMEMDEYVNTASAFLYNYCTSCSQSCRRRLEEEGQEAYDYDASAQIDCYECSATCKSFNANSGNFEFGCQESQDNDGDLALYLAPQCEGGDLVLGSFYDDECTIKAGSMDSSAYDYGWLFWMMEEVQIDCSSQYDTCQNFIANAVSCSNGADNDKLCSSAERASRERTYYKKPWYGKVEWTFIILLLVTLGVGLGFLSYTYYTHHKTKAALSSMDFYHQEDDERKGSPGHLA